MANAAKNVVRQLYKEYEIPGEFSLDKFQAHIVEQFGDGHRKENIGEGYSIYTLPPDLGPQNGPIDMDIKVKIGNGKFFVLDKKDNLWIEVGQVGGKYKKRKNKSKKHSKSKKHTKSKKYSRRHH